MTDTDDQSRELTDAEFDAIMAKIEQKRLYQRQKNKEYRLRQKQGIFLKPWHHKYPDWTITKDKQKHIAQKGNIKLTAWTKWRLEQKIRHEERIKCV